MAYQRMSSDDCDVTQKKTSPKTFSEFTANLKTYFDSPLWWTYERRRLGLPRSVRNVTDRAFRRYEIWRVSRNATQILGPRFKRSRNLIEIDITYVCNLNCPGCNRSCSQAPTNQRMTLEQVEEFIEESIASDYQWDGIRVLGGEPTLHPQFHEMLDALRKYRDEYRPHLRLTVVSNGHGDKVEASLAKIPDDILVENTAKSKGVQIDFAPFNNAPSDHPEHAHSDYRNGCWIAQGLGMGLGPNGYYCCAVAGGIDRVYGTGLGKKHIPETSDEMREQFETLCSLCGHFCIHAPLTTTPDGLSESWRGAYAAWDERVEAARKAKRSRHKSKNATPDQEERRVS